MKEFQRDLAVLSQVLHLNELKLLGGEPVLIPDLLEFLRCARASGLAEEITLITNGLLRHRCYPATFELIDRLQVSLYPGVRLRVEERESNPYRKDITLNWGLKELTASELPCSTAAIGMPPWCGKSSGSAPWRMTELPYSSSRLLLQMFAGSFSDGPTGAQR